MKLRRLSETQKLFPLWLDKTSNSNFTKHLSVVNEQNLDIYNSLKKLEYARLLEKPIQLIKKQNEAGKYTLTVKVNIDNLKKITIWENPKHEDIAYYNNDYQYNFKITSEPLDNYPVEFSETSINYYEDTITVISQSDEIIPQNKYLVKIETHDNYVFWKGYPENDTSEYSCNIDYQTINNRRVLSFSASAKNIQTVYAKRIENYRCIDSRFSDLYGKILEDKSKEIQLINYSYDEEGKNRFKYNYRLDDNEAINTETTVEVVITEEETQVTYNVKVAIEYSYELEVTLHNSTQSLKSIYPKSYSDYNSLFDHDYSLDMIGNMVNVPRHKYNKVSEKYYSSTLPPYNNKLTEDDYYYQERIKYYINHYNRDYFPVLEMKKHYGIDSKLINRYNIISQQGESYQQLNTGSSQLKEYNQMPNVINCYIYYDGDDTKYQPYKVYSIGDYDESNPLHYVTDDTNIYYVTEVVCTNDADYKIYNSLTETYLNKYCSFNSNTSKIYELINPKDWYELSFESGGTETYEKLKVKGDNTYSLSCKTYSNDEYCIQKYTKEHELKYYYKKPIIILIEFYDKNDSKISSTNGEIEYRNTKECDDDYFDLTFTTPKEVKYLTLKLTYINPFDCYNLSLNRLIDVNDHQYMRTKEDYNSCVYDLVFDYNDIPSNLKLPTDYEFDMIFNRCFPISKKGYTSIEKEYDDKARHSIFDKPFYRIANLIGEDDREGTDCNSKSISLGYSLNTNDTYVVSFKSTSSSKVYCEITDENDTPITTITPSQSSKVSIGGSEASNIDTEYLYEFKTPSTTSNTWKLRLKQDSGSFNYSDLKLYNKSKNNVKFR